MEHHRTPQQPVMVIACTAAKGTEAAPARDLYRGRNFGLALTAALAEVDQDAERVFILSARYGLIRLNAMVDPYDTRIEERDAGLVATITRQALGYGLSDHTEVYAMVPVAYRDVLREALEPIGTVPTPVFEDARGIGDHRHVMTKLAQPHAHEHQLAVFPPPPSPVDREPVTTSWVAFPEQGTWFRLDVDYLLALPMLVDTAHDDPAVRELGDWCEVAQVEWGSIDPDQVTQARAAERALLDRYYGRCSWCGEPASDEQGEVIASTNGFVFHRDCAQTAAARH